MKLTYRGVSYEKEVVQVNSILTSRTVKYRGTSYPVSQAEEVQLESNPKLVYRGVSTQGQTIYLEKMEQPVRFLGNICTAM